MNVFQSLFFLTISVCLIWISGGNSYIPHKLRSAGITDSSSQTFYPRNAPPVQPLDRPVQRCIGIAVLLTSGSV